MRLSSPPFLLFLPPPLSFTPQQQVHLLLSLPLLRKHPCSESSDWLSGNYRRIVQIMEDDTQNSSKCACE